MPTTQSTLALVGAGEFLPPMRGVDEHLLACSGGRRVAVVPTASAPDGLSVFERWAEMGERHFKSLGANVDPILARGRSEFLNPDIAQRLASADLIYFSGGKPDYLHAALKDTPSWTAVTSVLERGGIVAGCSAGAMILGAYIPGFRMRQLPGTSALWTPAFGLVPETVIIPHFNEIPRAILRAWIALRPRGMRVLGIDGGTAVVGRPGVWRVMGDNSVTVLGEHEERVVRAGSSFA